MSGKGGEFERQISKYLTKWLTGKDKPYAFWRTPGSGSLCTIHEENVELSGDIRSIIPEANFLTSVFNIELKTGYPGTSFWQHFSDTKTFKIREFWEQSVRDGRKANKLPMVIYRKKGKKPLMGMTYGVLDQILGIKKTYPYNSIIMSFRSKYDLPSMFLCDFEEFFSYVGVEQMRDACEELWRVLNIYGKT